MKEMIAALARGEFEYRKPSLLISEERLSIEAAAGCTYRGSFTLRNDKGREMKGILHCGDCNMRLSTDHFAGTSITITFEYQAVNRKVGDHEEGNICIISDCGEYNLPYTVIIEAPFCNTSIGKIRDLFHFANLAKEQPAEALKIFKSQDFKDVFLYRDQEAQVLYEGILRSTTGSHAMEEFLIAMHKKVRINLSVEKTHFEYENCTERFQDRLMLNKDNWGYTEIRIRSDVDFIVPEHKILWTDNFVGNGCRIDFEVLSDKLRVGRNFGRIFIETTYQTFVIEVVAKKKSTTNDRENTNAYGLYQVSQAYLNFRMRKMEHDEYISRMDSLFQSFREKGEPYFWQLLRAHVSTVGEREADLHEYLSEAAAMDQPKEGAPIEDVLSYCGYLYINALNKKEKEDIEKAVEGIHTFYDNGYMDWRILWFLLYVDRKYENQSVRLKEILMHLEEGCCSPILYYEAFQCYCKEPNLLHELNPVTLHIMMWGIRSELCTEELALRFTYQAGRIKFFYPQVFRCLVLLYRQYAMQDVLSSICTMLIRGEKTGPQYYEWYSLGIAKQLRITDIYEYYMYSMSNDATEPLPQSVLLYFLYENHMNDKRKAYLYMRIIKDKEKNPGAYHMYEAVIAAFAKKQLAAGAISSHLATIYEDYYTQENLDDNAAGLLDQVMFTSEIICTNSNMIGVCVIHPQTVGEVYLPFVDGHAQITMCNEQAILLLVDRNENRYYDTTNYTLNKMLHLEHYVHRCYEIKPESQKLLLHLYAQIESEYPVRKESVSIRCNAKQILKLRSYNQEKNNRVLLEYGREEGDGTLVDEILSETNLNTIEYSERAKLIELCVTREMDEKALTALEHYPISMIRLPSLEMLLTRCLGMEKTVEEAEEDEATKPQEQLEQQEQDKELESHHLITCICYRLYENGNYTVELLRYLIRNFRYTTKTMVELYENVHKLGYESEELQERTLSQILFTGCEIDKGTKILEDYAVKGSNRRLKKAFLSYLAYCNVIRELSIPEFAYQMMQHDIVFEENKICMLALLKQFSEQKKISEKEKAFIDYNVSKFMEQGIVFEFFKQFAGVITLPDKLKEVSFVQYKGDPDSEVNIYYRLGRDEPEQMEHMKNVFCGIFSKAFVLFSDEELCYRITVKNKGSAEEEITSDTLVPKCTEGDVGYNRFRVLNQILMDRHTASQTELNTEWLNYVKKDNVVKQCFTIL